MTANDVFRRVSLLGVSSIVGGVLVGGVLGRVVMRISAIAAGPAMTGQLTENGNRIGEFTLVGTITLIVFVGGLGGVVASSVVVGSDPWLSWMGPVKGVGFGIVTLAMTGGGDPFDSTDFLRLDPPALNVAMFLGLHLIFGLVAFACFRVLEGRLPPTSQGLQIGYMVTASMGVFPLLLVIALFTVPSFCGCEPNYLPLFPLLAMVAATTVRYLARLGITLPRWLSPLSTIVGYGSLAALVTIGLSGSIAQIVRILA